MNFGYTGCHSSVPGIQRLAVYTGEALQELEEALLPDVAEGSNVVTLTAARKARKPAVKKPVAAKKTPVANKAPVAAKSAASKKAAGGVPKPVTGTKPKKLQ